MNEQQQQQQQPQQQHHHQHQNQEHHGSSICSRLSLKELIMKLHEDQVPWMPNLTKQVCI